MLSALDMPRATNDEIWGGALQQAWRSFGEGNAGIGAVLVTATGLSFYGRSKTLQGDEDDLLSRSPVAHAEIEALQHTKGGTARGGRLYSTLQPCLMCTGAALMADLAEVVFLAPDPAWPTCEEMVRGNHWRQSACHFRHEDRRESAFALLLPLITFAERLTPIEYAVYLSKFPSISTRALEFARNGYLRDMAATKPLDAEIIQTWAWSAA